VIYIYLCGGDFFFGEEEGRRGQRWTAVNAFQPSAASPVQVARTSPYMPSVSVQWSLELYNKPYNKQLSTKSVSFQSLLSLTLQRTVHIASELIWLFADSFDNHSVWYEV
jgi:hypothetical protein